MNMGFIITIIGLVILVVSPLFLIILMFLGIDVFRIEDIANKAIEEEYKRRKNNDKRNVSKN